jgi:hypothetical protein
MGNYVNPSNDVKQADGSTAVTATSTNVNTGRAKGIGSLSTLLTNLGLYRSNHDAYGSKVVELTNITEKALSTGTFAYTVGSIIRRVTLKLSGVSNTALQTGASNFGQRRAIHQVVSVRSYLVATAIRAGSWTEYTAKWTTTGTAPTAQNDFSTMVTTNTDADGGGTTDEAANPTYAKPGELVYRSGKPEPVQADYSAKTS